MPKGGLEPPLCLQKWILNPPRLPFRHFGLRPVVLRRGRWYAANQPHPTDTIPAKPPSVY